MKASAVAARVAVVDLDGVEFLGSAGLSALVEANELATEQDRALRLACHSQIANRALETTELRALHLRQRRARCFGKNRPDWVGKTPRFSVLCGQDW